jgi:hypothetical protein
MEDRRAETKGGDVMSPQREAPARFPFRRRTNTFILDAIGQVRVSQIFPCWNCRAADCRDAAHTRGCPALPPVTDEEVYRRQRECMAAWAGSRG